MGLAWVRYRLELDADVQRWRRMLAIGMTPDNVRARAYSFADTVSGGTYLFAWPRAWARWGFARKAEKEIAK